MDGLPKSASPDFVSEVKVAPFSSRTDDCHGGQFISFK